MYRVTPLFLPYTHIDFHTTHWTLVGAAVVLFFFFFFLIKLFQFKQDGDALKATRAEDVTSTPILKLLLYKTNQVI